jgi:hypothetical protein
MSHHVKEESKEVMDLCLYEREACKNHAKML